MNFIDLSAQYKALKSEIDEAVAEVLNRGDYILGKEVDELEDRLSSYVGVQHCVTCANGTDSLQMILMASGIRSGDVVICPSFTFAATAEVISLVGAEVAFADVCSETFNICIESLTDTVKACRQAGRNVRAVIAVDLFGLPANHLALEEYCKTENLSLIVDSAQGFGSMIGGRKSCSYGIAASTSFFPAKPLGCYGDGGAIFTNDERIADTLRSIRVHGKGGDKYENIRVGLNSRLDTIQAAVLLVKFSVYEEEVSARNDIADRYGRELGGYCRIPCVPDGQRSVWAQYTLVLENALERKRVSESLADAGVPTAVYYPRPLHTQPAYHDAFFLEGRLSNSEYLAERVLSIPMHPYLRSEDQELIVECLKSSL